MAIERTCGLNELERQLTDCKERGSVVEKAVVITELQGLCDFIRALTKKLPVTLEITKRNRDANNPLGFLNFSTKGEMIQGTEKNNAVGYTLVVRDDHNRPVRMWNLVCSTELAAELFPDDVVVLKFNMDQDLVPSKTKHPEEKKPEPPVEKNPDHSQLPGEVAAETANVKEPIPDLTSGNEVSDKDPEEPQTPAAEDNKEAEAQPQPQSALAIQVQQNHGGNKNKQQNRK